MDKTVTYLKLLEDSLHKKKQVLLNLINLTKEQTALFSQQQKNSERHEEILSEKQQQIDELNQLDDGFETIYNNISNIIKRNKTLYQDEIKRLQVLIGEITDLSVNLQAQEIKNKEQFTVFLKQQRSGIRKAREGNKMSGKYYQNMSNHHQQGQTYFLDKKK